MAEWKAYYTFWSDDVTHYFVENFVITDELKEKIDKAITDLIPLTECDFYQELYSIADCSFDDLDCFSEDDEVVFVDLTVDDPGDLLRLKQKFVGKKFDGYNPEWGNEIENEYENYEVDQCYTIKYIVDDNGVLIDMDIISSEGIESVSIKYTDMGECYPDYDFLCSEIESEFE